MRLWPSALVVAALLAASPVRAESVATWQPFIAEASQRFGIPESWIMQVMRAESGGRTKQNGRLIRSRVGAMGLMQLMPATWNDMRVRFGLGNNPDDPRDNILAGTAYLRLMADRFGYPGCFAAYNAGPARYAAYVAGRSRLPAETIAYVRTVAPRGQTVMPQSQIAATTINVAPTEQEHVPSQPSLFFVTRVAAEPPSEGEIGERSGGLFAIKKLPPVSTQ